jgi:hypothetical protein
MIEVIRRQIPHEEFDYQGLMQALKEYDYPRDKITSLLRTGAIIRVKKGLYIFGDDYRRRPYSREVLANLIYGPSYISLEFALQHHGMIPERVESVTSVAWGRSRKFLTPVGLFTYWGIPVKAFRTGMDRAEIDGGRSFLIAVPEKALADKVQHDRGIPIRSLRDLETYLYDDLRLDPAVLREMDPRFLSDLADRYRSRKVRLLGRLVQRIKRHGEEAIDA